MSGYTAGSGVAMPGSIPVITTGGNGLGAGGIGDLLIGALLFGGGGLLGGNRWGMNAGYAGCNGFSGPVPQAATTAVASDIVLQPAFQSLQNQINNLSNSVSETRISDSINDAIGTFTQGNSDINSNINNVTRDISASIASVQAQQNSQAYTDLVNINSLGRDIQTSNTQALIQSLNNFAGLNSVVTNGFNSTSGTMVNGFNNMNLQLLTGFNGVNNALCDIKSTMQQCCCETQKTIAADGQATRQLINDLNVQSLTSQLNDAKAALSNANQTNYLQNALTQQAGVIIQHMPKCNYHHPYFVQTGNGNGNGNNGNGNGQAVS